MGNLGGPGSIHAVLGLATIEVNTWQPACAHVIPCSHDFAAVLLHVALVCFDASVWFQSRLQHRCVELYKCTRFEYDTLEGLS